MIVWHRDWYEQFDPGHIGEMLRTIRKNRIDRESAVPEDWHPHMLRDKPADPEPVVAPAYSAAAMIDAYRQQMAAAGSSAPPGTHDDQRHEGDEHQ